MGPLYGPWPPSILLPNTHTASLCPLLAPSLSHTFISPLWVYQEQLCLPLCTSLKEPFIAAGRGTSAHLLSTEGFKFTTSCLLATRLPCKHSQGKCYCTVSRAQTERQRKKLLQMRNLQMLSQTLVQG